VVVWDGQARWQPDSGQFLFNFEPVTPEREPARLIPKAAKGSGESSRRTAEQWMVLAMELETESPEEARRAYHEALRLEPDRVDAHINLGLLYHRDGQLQEAETCYRKAIESAPQEVLGYFNLAVVLTDKGNRKQAIEAYETVVTLLPSFAEAHCNLGTLYEAEGQRTQAIQHYAAAKGCSRANVLNDDLALSEGRRLPLHQLDAERRW
jgi:tetratricopeptide (TPR) repeat protein